MALKVVVRSVPGERFTQVIESGNHRFFADRQEASGGSDKGPGPYSYLLASLGSWISITLRMYAELKSMPLRDIEVSLSHNRIDRKKSHAGEKQPAIKDEIISVIRLKGDLNAKQRDRLLKIATRCWVHRTLTSKVEIETTTDQDV